MHLNCSNYRKGEKFLDPSPLRAGEGKMAGPLAAPGKPQHHGRAHTIQAWGLRSARGPLAGAVPEIPAYQLQGLRHSSEVPIALEVPFATRVKSPTPPGEKAPAPRAACPSSKLGGCRAGRRPGQRSALNGSRVLGQPLPAGEGQPFTPGRLVRHRRALDGQQAQ